MSDWFSTGFVEAEKVSTQSRRNRNFWTKPDESAVIRFLVPAKDTFNYKRAFVPWAKGQKLFTSPGSMPDPLVEAGLQLQASFAWRILDRRTFDIEVEEEGKTVTKTVGPRVVYFADGQRTRKALIAFENEMRKQINEEREEDNLPPLSEEEYNLTSFDVKVVKGKGAPWQFFALRGGKPKELTKADRDVAEKQDFNLVEELKPLPLDQLREILHRDEPSSSNEEVTEYSYGDDTEVQGETFFDE